LTGWKGPLVIMHEQRLVRSGHVFALTIVSLQQRPIIHKLCMLRPPTTAARKMAWLRYVAWARVSGVSALSDKGSAARCQEHISSCCLCALMRKWVRSKKADKPRNNGLPALETAQSSRE
jgi:hypothetical protein